MEKRTYHNEYPFEILDHGLQLLGVHCLSKCMWMILYILKSTIGLTVTAFLNCFAHRIDVCCYAFLVTFACRITHGGRKKQTFDDWVIRMYSPLHHSAWNWIEINSIIAFAIFFCNLNRLAGDATNNLITLRQQIWVRVFFNENTHWHTHIWRSFDGVPYEYMQIKYVHVILCAWNHFSCWLDSFNHLGQYQHISCRTY